MLARRGTSRPAKTKVSCPSNGAASGVAGARSTSTSRKTARTCSRHQVRNFCAWRYQAAGVSAGQRGGRGSAVQIRRAGAQATEVKLAGLGRGNEVGGGAGEMRYRQFDAARDAERGGERGDGGMGEGFAARLEITAQHRDTRKAGQAAGAGGNRLDPTLGTSVVVRIGPLHDVVDDRGEITHRTGERSDMVEAVDKGKLPVRGACRRWVSGPRCRRKKRVRGSSRSCRSRARRRHEAAATAAAEPPEEPAGGTGEVARVVHVAVVRRFSLVKS